MRTIYAEDIKNAVADLINQACTHITVDGKRFIEAALNREQNSNARFALSMLKENADTAEAKGIPVCQDTGMAVVFLSVGQDAHVEGGLISDAVNAGVKEGYANFRASVLDPVTRINTGDNTPAVIHTQIVEGDRIKIEFLPKGFGSENMSKLYMLTPSQGLDGVIDSIVDAVKSAGSNPCPPIVVGVGLGGTAEKAMELAKRQLLRDLDDVNPDAKLAELEGELLEKINGLNIGAQGFGGNNTAYAVKIGKYPTHISALPVAVNVQCTAIRHASVEL